jgi:hypothetical protein
MELSWHTLSRRGAWSGGNFAYVLGIVAREDERMSLDNELPQVKEAVQQEIDSLEGMRNNPFGNLR